MTAKTTSAIVTLTVTVHVPAGTTWGTRSVGELVEHEVEKVIGINTEWHAEATVRGVAEVHEEA